MDWILFKSTMLMGMNFTTMWKQAQRRKNPQQNRNSFLQEESPV